MKPKSIRHKIYTNQQEYQDGDINAARNELGPFYYRYDNFGPSFLDNHAGSFKAIESFDMGGDFIFEVYEYEAMSLSLGGHVSGPKLNKAVRFLRNKTKTT
jgi:hypothetical protein